MCGVLKSLSEKRLGVELLLKNLDIYIFKLQLKIIFVIKMNLRISEVG